MKVLQIYKDYYPPVQGGIERHLNTLAQGLRQRGVDVTVLVSNTGSTCQDLRLEGIRVIKAPQLARIFSAPLNPTLPRLLRRLAGEADLLHFHMPNPTAEMSWLFSCLTGVRKRKTVVTYHSDIVRQRFSGALYRPFLRKFLDRADAVVVTSPDYVKTSRVLRDYRRKCRTVPLGIDMARFQSAVAENEIDRVRRRYGPKIVLFVGRFCYYKGLDVLVRAMGRVRGNLLLIGDGPCRTGLRKMVAKLNLEHKVFFLGALSDREADVFFNACDVFALPSTFRSEAFGLAQLEAMAWSRPVVSTELTTGTSYVNQHNLTGLVVPPGDAGALALSLNRILADGDLRERMGLAAAQRAREHFNHLRMIDDILTVYRQCCHLSD